MSPSTPAWDTSADTIAATGMALAIRAREAPSRPAIIDRFGEHSYGKINARCNQLLAAIRNTGAGSHSGVSLICSNRAEFIEAYAAAQRGGLRLTPVNWHLTGEEMAYIVADSESEVIIAEARFKEVAEQAAADAPNVKLKLAIGGEIPGFINYDEALAAFDDANPVDPELGSPMLYTSGTTGRPKGVYRWPPKPSKVMALLIGQMITFKPGEDLTLIAGPLYHAAPLSLNAIPSLHSGVGLVLMDKWDPEETLQLIEKHQIAYTHMVATMFNRLLKLPEEVRNRYDVSSMRCVVHGAAPCPRHVKQAMIDWFGPVLYEYYAATEGGATLVTSSEWMERPGTVGKAIEGTGVRVLDESKHDCAPGVMGKVYLMAPEDARFKYFKAPEKTSGAYHENFFTLGDQGHLDADGYLFLTGRDAETIISGGVNIYPQEIDDLLLQFPGVQDVCTIGVPNEDWGEEVKAVVELAEGVDASDTLAEELLSYCREHLAKYKCPKSVTFDTDLPRLPSGKIQRHKVRAPFWANQSQSI